MVARASTMGRIVFTLLAIHLPALLEGKVQKGTIKLGGALEDTSNWQFLSKFGYGLGTGEYSVRFRQKNTKFDVVEFAVILDEEWSKVQTLSDCHARNAEARKTHNVVFGTPYEWSRWEYGSVTQNIRPHIWYFAASKCAVDLRHEPVHLEYEIKMAQDGGSEFSVEMRGMMTLNFMVLACLVAFLVHFCRRCCVFASSAGKLHQVIWTLSATIVLQFAAQSLHTLHLWKYQSNGVGSTFADLLSEVLFMLGQVLQTTLLIAIAMGYTLLPSRNQCMAVVKWIVLMALIVHAALVSFGKMQEESASKYHENEGAIGWVLLSVRVMLYVWFLFATQATQREGGLRLHDFMQRFRLAGSLYFLAYPILFMVVQIFAAYLQYPIMQIGLIAVQTASIVWLAELFLSRGAYFKVSALSASFLPGSHGAFDKMS